MTDFKTVYTKILEEFRNKPEKTSNILTEIKDNCLWITLNRPKIMNAFTLDMTIYFTDILNTVNQMPEIKYIIVTGNGGNFSAGNDLNNFVDPFLNQFEEKQIVVEAQALICEDFCTAFIMLKKPIFALTEGRVVGFTFTQLSFYDKIFAIEDSVFMAPLVKIAQGPEMCSSYMFPKLFGRKLAEQLVIEGRPIKAQDLQKIGFLQCFKSINEAKNALNHHLSTLDQLQWKSYLAARQLFRDPERQLLMRINHNQCQNLVERWDESQISRVLSPIYAKAQAIQKEKMIIQYFLNGFF